MHLTTLYIERVDQDGPYGSRLGVTLALEPGDDFETARAYGVALLWPDPADRQPTPPPPALGTLPRQTRSTP